MIVSIRSTVQGLLVDDVFFDGICIIDTIMSPNERVSPTTAGTKQSPIKSLIANPSVLLSKSSFHATKCKVNIGENIAYIQSLIARRRSIAMSAITSNQNTRSITALMTILLSNCPAVLIFHIVLSILL